MKHFLLVVLSGVILSSCNTSGSRSDARGETDTLPAASMHLAEYALRGLSLADGLQVTVMATEPTLRNPTNIEVDARGRIWVTEAYNYRPDINGNPVNVLGDRIMILEDLDTDGKVDTAKVFYQGPELNAPLGICVLDNRVIVSQSPYVWIFHDDNRDDKADRKEILFQGIDGEQHDHGAHAFVFGADGKLYFNFGNEGKQLKDSKGNIVKDQDGDPIDSRKYKQGMVFRCNPDGSHVECLGQNFRNPFELAVDSYGTIWQSDNDDDGNRSTRINYVMEYGNYGYTDEITGAGWQANRTNLEDSVYRRHWHLNDPGTVPNLLQTYAGSPTGMVVYEGKLLPAVFQGQLIHCDAGPNVVRSYAVANNGAGYTATINDMLKGDRDKWFRPADVCVAPDGSLIVADWYDPGVGGHAAGDQSKGRIYRIAPAGNNRYAMPSLDFASADGLVSALQNPNLAVRYLAFAGLQQMGAQAIAPLQRLWAATNADARMRARAFWVLAKLDDANAGQYIDKALTDANPNLRIVGLRASQQQSAGATNAVKQLLANNEADLQVLRECALALHHSKDKEAADLWVKLAQKSPGNDRWYLEALGIGADKQWDAFFASYQRTLAQPPTDVQKEIIWRSRAIGSMPYVVDLASQATPLEQRLKYFRAFDFIPPSQRKTDLLIGFLQRVPKEQLHEQKLIVQALDIDAVKSSPIAAAAVASVLASVQGTDEYVELIGKYKLKAYNKQLLDLAITKCNDPLGQKAMRVLLELGGKQSATAVLAGNDAALKVPVLIALSRVGSKESIQMLETVALSTTYADTLRRVAARRIGNSWAGEERVLALLKDKKVPAALVPDVVASVEHAWRGSVREEAAQYLPASSRDAKPAPTWSELAALKSEVTNGQAIFDRSCAMCHQVNTSGYDFGPKLSKIGAKLPGEAMLEAIVNPSSGIGFGYEGWEIKLKDGSSVYGIISSRTETDIEVKLPGGGKQQVKTAAVLALTQMKKSMMTDGLYKSMTNQELADLIGYLQRLK